MSSLSLLLVALLAGCTPAAPASTAPDAPSRSETDRAPARAATPATQDSTDWRAFFEGEWTGDDPGDSAPGLGCPKALTVDVASTQVLCIVPNQVWITARWAIDEAAGRALLYLVDPEDVGSFGQQLPWDSFSREAPIATMEPDLGEGRYASVTWHGFRAASDAAPGDDFGSWYDGSYTPADGDTRIPTR